MSFRSPMRVRNHFFYNVVNCSKPQRRWAQVHDVRFLVTHQRDETVTGRYQSKLEQKAKSEGYRDVEDMKANYQEKIEAQRKKAQLGEELQRPSDTSAQPPSSSPSTASQTPDASSVQQAASQFTSKSAGIKTLSSFIDVPKILQLSQKEIEYLWRLRHAKDARSLCAVIPQATYNRIEATARRHPQFILPLPREGQGAEIHFLQWTFPSPTTATVLFTHLAEYKLRGEYAQPHTTVTHHLDLADPKGLILLQGTVMDNRGITVEEGRWLLMCLQKFYAGEEKTERQRLLEQFSEGNGDFKVEQLLEETEKTV